MSIELLSELNDNILLGLTVHRELADTFYFIGLSGYSYQHEYQYISESCTQREVKQYMTKTYFTFLPDKIEKSANIIEPLLTGKNRKSLKKQDVWNMTQKLWETYCKWETDALKLYEQIASDLFSKGSVSAFNFVTDIIRDVKIELDFINDKIVELEAHGFDMPQIIADQSEYIERYEYLIKNLHGESKKFHHWNSAHDPLSRILFKKTPDA